MICHTNKNAKIFVVDPQATDYAGMVGDAVYDSVKFIFFENGRGALSSPTAEEPELWVGQHEPTRHERNGFSRVAAATRLESSSHVGRRRIPG